MRGCRPPPPPASAARPPGVVVVVVAGGWWLVRASHVVPLLYHATSGAAVTRGVRGRLAGLALVVLLIYDAPL